MYYSPVRKLQSCSSSCPAIEFLSAPGAASMCTVGGPGVPVVLKCAALPGPGARGSCGLALRTHAPCVLM